MFDPFEVIDKADAEAIDANMVVIPIGNKVLGIDEGIFMGILIGCLITTFIGEMQ